MAQRVNYANIGAYFATAAFAIMLPSLVYQGTKALYYEPQHVKEAIETVERLNNEIPEIKHQLDDIKADQSQKDKKEQHNDIYKNRLVPKQEKRAQLKYDVIRPFQKRVLTITFSAYILIGVISLGLGLFFAASHLGIACILGGFLCIATGYATSWPWLNNTIIFISLLVGILFLAALLHYTRRFVKQ